MSRKRRYSGSKRRFAGAAITGAALREKRMKAGMTQAQLAQASGYTAVYISALETGRTGIGEKAARLLLSCLR
jgi:transcriptional regulator with XRE-family HTH domain